MKLLITIENYELMENEITELKEHLWKYFGDISKKEIIIKNSE